MRLVDRFDEIVHLRPERPFVRDGALTRTYGESFAETNRIARAIRRDAPPGARVAVWSTNSAAMLECLYGIFRAGAVFVPLNARNAVEENLAILGSYGVVGLVIERQFLDRCPDPRAVVPGLRFVVVLGEGESAGTDGGAPTLEAWRDRDDSPVEAPAFTRDSPWAVYSTSGTTGRPRGVCHSHLNALTSTLDLASSLGVRDGVTHLVVSPLTHMAGLMTFALTGAGSTHVLCPSAKPDAVIAALTTGEIDTAFLPPTVIYSVLAALAGERLEGLRRLVTAGAPISLARAEDVIAVFGPVLYNIYAQAEGFGPLTCLRPEDYADPDTGALDRRRLGSVGRATPPRILRVMGDDGELLAPDTPGEIVVRSFTVLDGYLGEAADTAGSPGDAWHHTGDVGVLDRDGYLSVVDRKRDMIITGGFNVFSVEVENALHTHPDVREAAVIGVADDRWGEAVTAVVELEAGASADAHGLIEHCKRRIGSMKAPKRVEFRDELPRNNNGKVLKKVLRNPA